MKLIARIGMAAAVAFGATGSAQAVTIVNPSFELGAIGGGFQTKGPGGDLPGWTIGGSIDHIANYWNAQDGDKSIDLNGNGAGTISQLLTGLYVGTTYRVSFWVSGNPDNNMQPDEKLATLSWGSGTSTVSYTLTALNAVNNMQWEERSYTFVATSTSALLSLASDQQNPYGLAVDNFSISAVPEPATWAMMIGGFGAAGVTLRRRRRTTTRAAIA